ncbi:MAG: hypothetical protein ABFD97_25405 [Syntrophobacter sp.]
MKKVLLVTMSLMLFSFMLSGPAFSWQGRMAGMGDPTGLVEDESDLLIHPSAITNIKTFKMFGDYKFTYYDHDSSWGANLSSAVTIPFIGATIDWAGGNWSADGPRYQHDALVGFAAPVGAGTGGLFITYKGVRSDFDGNSALAGSAEGYTAALGSSFNLKNYIDDIAIKGIYGMPLTGDLKWGAEVQVAYHREENKTTNSITNVSLNGEGFLGDASFVQRNDFWGFLFPFTTPRDDEFWELSAKTGLEGMLGPAKIGVTVRGGAFVGGNSNWNYSDTITMPSQNLSLRNGFDLSGDVDGWRVGGDIWARVPYSNTVSLPFVLKMDYMERNRSGSGTGSFSDFTGELFGDPTSATLAYGYNGKEKILNIETGGGVDIQMSQSFKLAAGLYYNYINYKQSLSLVGSYPSLELPYDIPLFINFDYANYPERTEHLVRFKLAAEQQYSPTTTFRGGLQVFGGTAEESYSFAPNVNNTLVVLNNQGNLDGTHWGIMGSLGASFQFSCFVLEPFVQAGYQELSLSDSNGLTSVISVPLFPWNLSRDTKDVVVSVGASIKF